MTLSVIDSDAFKFDFHANENHLALHVADVAAARETLAGRGVEFHGDTLDTGVCHMAFFADPAGNKLMLHSRYAPREREDVLRPPASHAGRTTHRKPTWLMPVSTCCGRRAAGR